MEPKAKAALVVVVFLFSIVTTTHSHPAYASSSKRIFLIQQFEQFPGQELVGHCNLRIDEEGNLEWRIKISGLSPLTQGHFDLGHWAGESDVPFTADNDGNADSQNQIILSKNLPSKLFSQFAKCKVYTSGFNHFTSPVIAIGNPNPTADDNVNQDSSKEESSKNDNESKVSIPIEKKFFLFVTLEYVFDMIKNTINPISRNDSNISKNNPIFSENDDSDLFSDSDSIFGPPSPLLSTHPTDKGSTDKGSTDKGSTDKGSTDKNPNNNKK